MADMVDADITNAVFTAFNRLPKRGKPVLLHNGSQEWAILSGIVIDFGTRPRNNKDSETSVDFIDPKSANQPESSINISGKTDGSYQKTLKCVALGLGLKALPRKLYSEIGDLVVDSHSEVLARRAFSRLVLSPVVFLTFP